MPDDGDSADNVERLLAHLETDTLAVQLVGPFRDAQGGDTAGELELIKNSGEIVQSAPILMSELKPKLLNPLKKEGI